MQEYEIRFPERGTQRTPPYTGYIDHEPLKLPGYGERRKPLEKEVPTAYRFPNGISRLESELENTLNETGFWLSSGDNPLKPFFPTSTGFGISINPPLPEIREYHETFKIDRYDNFYGGHSSITIGKRKIRGNHEDDF